MKRLLLLGGGHAHVHVLKTLTETAPADVEVTLVSPYARQVYSGMLPGWIAGHYPIDACVIPLMPLCAKAGVRLLETAATGIDLAARVVHCADGSEIGYDVVSIDTGPVADMSMVPGAAEHAIAVRPIESFIDSFRCIADDIAARAAAGKLRHHAAVGSASYSRLTKSSQRRGSSGGGESSTALVMSTCPSHALGTTEASLPAVSSGCPPPVAEPPLPQPADGSSARPKIHARVEAGGRRSETIQAERPITHTASTMAIAVQSSTAAA